jgi:uncharacterized protein YjlB
MAHIQSAQEATNREAHTRSFVCESDGAFPNNPMLPVVLYQAAVRLPQRGDPASVLEQLFSLHGWSGSWRDTVYDYAHYHSNAHEVLGCYRGTAQLEIGGRNALRIQLSSGDVIALPAGVAHRKISGSQDFHVVGAYAGGRDYDMCRGGADELERTRATIRSLPMPEHDPVYGHDGPVMKLWR